MKHMYQHLKSAMVSLVARIVLGAAVIWLGLVTPSLGSVVAVPDFRIVGQPADTAVRIFSAPTEGDFPKQISLDINAKGTIYSISCTYKSSKGLFAALREKCQEAIRCKPTPENSKIVAWRNEDQKLVVSLSIDEEQKKIMLLVVSISKDVKRD